MFRSRYMPCSDCGASVDRADATPHACDPERVVDYHLFAMRPDIDRFDAAVVAFLESPVGRFEAWQARRVVRGEAA